MLVRRVGVSAAFRTAANRRGQLNAAVHAELVAEADVLAALRARRRRHRANGRRRSAGTAQCGEEFVGRREALLEPRISAAEDVVELLRDVRVDRKSTRLNSSHL